MGSPERVTPPPADLHWPAATRIIRSLHPPIDLFEDIADPADWPALIAAEQKTNPRLAESIGNLGLVPPSRRVAGPGATFVMAPFTHISRDRPSRFSDGSYGVLYAGNSFDVALFETLHHHGRFMARTGEPPGWASQFREIVLDIEARVYDLREHGDAWRDELDPDDYTAAQALGKRLRLSTLKHLRLDSTNRLRLHTTRSRHAAAEAIAFPSVRQPSGECVGLFFPDLARNARQGRHLDYHWDGERVDLYRDAGSKAVFRLL